MENNNTCLDCSNCERLECTRYIICNKDSMYHLVTDSCGKFNEKEEK